MALDFEGIRVLDFSQVIAGPLAAQHFALLGADVIKIEPPGGDQMRDRMLPSRYSGIGMAPGFLAMNIGKRSLCLDMKHPEGKALVHELIRSADVLIHNYRSGVVERLGLDYPSVREINPCIVWCSITGFGNTGPRRAAAAYDGAIQAASGMMSNNGHPDTGPTRTGYFPVDAMSGVSAAFAIAAALVRRQRTGEGKAIDVAMFDAGLLLQNAACAQYLVEGIPGGLVGNSSASKAPSADSFPTGDGVVLSSAVQQGQVEAMCEELGIADVLRDERFATPQARAANAAAFRERLVEAFAADSAANWVRRLSARGVPISKVNSIAEATADAREDRRSVLLSVGRPRGYDHDVELVGTPFTSPQDAATALRPPPALGEHSREVLSELGLDGDRIRTLVEKGVVIDGA
jgi:crotonobetainyl-CoA:carnitine CoA-transferase CaiB-like acyl-CoA transferase